MTANLQSKLSKLTEAVKRTGTEDGELATLIRQGHGKKPAPLTVAQALEMVKTELGRLVIMGRMRVDGLSAAVREALSDTVLGRWMV